MGSTSTTSPTHRQPFLSDLRHAQGIEKVDETQSTLLIRASSGDTEKPSIVIVGPRFIIKDLESNLWGMSMVLERWLAVDHSRLEDLGDGEGNLQQPRPQSLAPKLLYLPVVFIKVSGRHKSLTVISGNI